MQHYTFPVGRKETAYKLILPVDTQAHTLSKLRHQPVKYKQRAVAESIVLRINEKILPYICLLKQLLTLKAAQGKKKKELEIKETIKLGKEQKWMSLHHL